MAFQTPLTISEVVDKINTKKYLLPSIQREFVWKPEQITKLFDSIMRGYPINSFLFWEVRNENINQFKFYEFLRDYHQKNNRHNEKANLNGNEEILAILDGQQRLTSLYIGLKGSYAYKLSHRCWDNEQAYPKRKLYLNLLKDSDDTEFEYDFDFLTDEEASENGEEKHWFEVGKILDLKEQSDVNEYLIDNDLSSNQDKDKARFANRTLFKLHSSIHTTPAISYYLEKNESLDKVLNIFIRVNSGGTTLSYSDLLLSFATAQWEKLDAREEINNFVDEINDIGQGFNVNKDFVLKACLVLCDFSDISFKVDNFNKSNMSIIENKWDEITEAIRQAIKLIASFGFSRENITSNNLIIPIAYYLKTIGLPNNFEIKSSCIEDRNKIRKWFVTSLLKKVFSFMPDGVLKPIREIIKNNKNNEFPLDEIVQKFRTTNRSLIFTDDNIENLLYSKYGQGQTMVIMSLLYPWADLRNNFHIDHMYPKSAFTQNKLIKRKYDQETIKFYLENYNYLGNLQLLESIPNIEKKDSEFDKWVRDTIPSDQIEIYKQKHLIPLNVALDFDNFENFLIEREKLIIDRLKSILQ